VSFSTDPPRFCRTLSFFFLSGEAVCLGRVRLERVTGSGSYWAKKVKRRLYCGGPKHGNETVRSSNLFVFFFAGTTAHDIYITVEVEEITWKLHKQQSYIMSPKKKGVTL
jgi:hypothetical protein